MGLIIKDYVSSLLMFGFGCLLLITSLLITVHANEPETAGPIEENGRPFSYVDGAPNGPQNWGNLNYPAWKKCGTGKTQSPINIPVNRAVLSPRLGPLWKLYKPAPAIIKNRGHYITVEWTGDAGGITINHTWFKLQQVHWHTPAEHSINGARYNMELHLVHSSSSGNTAVIAVHYAIGPPDSFLQRLAPYLRKVSKEGTELGLVHPFEIRFDISSFYRYEGSLTTPPCSENVTWTVVKQVNTVSAEQIKALRAVIHDGDVGNARPIQSLNGRTISIYRF